MLNILISAYAVSPNWGSEPGVGWNWVINLAKYCNVHVITESQWQKEIEAARNALPQRENLHFYYNSVPDKVRKICWNQGDWRFYYYYRKWQKKTLSIAREIISNNHIDIIHQLNMIGFREPGYLWGIKDIPFIWGPIGNMAPTPIEYLHGNTFKEKIKLRIKNAISYIQVRTGRVNKAIKRANQLITVLDSSASIIKKEYGIENVIIMPETGLKVSKEVIHESQEDKKIKLLWVGRFIPTKKLDFALQILSQLRLKDKFELNIVGGGTEAEISRYRKMAKDLNVDSMCKWHGVLPNNEVQTLMKESDLFLFTSVLEGTPHVVLEAISNNLPVICFDLCGQGVIVNEQVGWKMPVSSLPKAIDSIVDTLNYLQEHRNEISQKSRNCEQRKPELSWENKISQVVNIYSSLINGK